MNIYNNEHYKKFLAGIKEQGDGSIHVIADFDKTLTRSGIPSLIAVLRDDEKYLGKQYAQKAHELFNTYHTYEVDPVIPDAEKRELMHERYSLHFDLLVASGLSQEMIYEAMQDNTINLRSGVPQFLDMLHKRNIPLIILSASGLGTLAIQRVLSDYNILSDNITIISNEYEWDASGKAVSVKQPIIHSMNKDETALREHPIFAQMKNRKNVLLLGDSINDPKMIYGFDYDTLLQIGFLADDRSETIELYKKYYDVLVLNDGGVEEITKLFL